MASRPPGCSRGRYDALDHGANKLLSLVALLSEVQELLQLSNPAAVKLRHVGVHEKIDIGC